MSALIRISYINRHVYVSPVYYAQYTTTSKAMQYM